MHFIDNLHALNRWMYAYSVLVLCTILLCACSGGDVVAPSVATTGSLQGVVHDESLSKPVPGVQISTIPGSSSVFTDSIGSYRIEAMMPGDYVVRAYKTERSGATSALLPVRIVVGANTTADMALRDTAQQQGFVCGTIIDRGGKPVVGAVVTSSPATSTTTSDSLGRFNLYDVPPGRYMLYANTDELGGNAEIDVAIHVPTYAALRLLPRDTITGTVAGTVMSAGSPLAGVVVSIGILGRTDTTDKEGRYALQSILPGFYTIKFYKDGYKINREQRAIAVGEQRTVDVTMTLGPDISQDSLELYLTMSGECSDHSPNKRQMRFVAGSYAPDRFGDPSGALECFGAGGVRTETGDGLRVFPMTFGAWLYLPSGAIDDAMLFGKAKWGSGDGYYVQLRNSALRIMYETNYEQNSAYYDFSVFPRDTWFWIGMSISNEGTGYATINGKQALTLSLTRAVYGPIINQQPFFVGDLKENGNGLRGLYGKIDHVVVYSRRMPLNELKQIMEQGD